MENLVGRKIKGFRFEDSNLLTFNSKMKDHIGEIGVVVHQYGNKVTVKFHDWHVWQYPLDQIEKHLIPLESVEVFKLGQKVWDMSISEEAGRVVGGEIFNYPIRAKFGNISEYYKIDGINPQGQKTLSTTPYKFQGFSQESIIERGAVVYFRNSKNLDWNFGFYSHRCENEFDYCFVDQQKEGDSLPWNFCQTENPLL